VEISQRPKLNLGDIAIVTGADAQLLKQINKLVLREDARGLLLSQHLESSEILKKIRNALNENDFIKKANPIFKVPSKVTVNFSTTSISQEEVERKIQNFLMIQCADCSYQLSIQSFPDPSSREWDLELDQMSAKGGLLVPLREVGNRTLKYISGTVRISRLVPVAKRHISQGERLLDTDVEMISHDVTFAKDQGLKVEDVIGLIAVRSLTAGNPISKSDLRREPAAMKGQIVKGFVGDENFEVAVNLEVQDNGFIGDVIKVKNIENNKYFSALVIEKGVVKVQ
jgi:flagella basal body P-ring formation protein FlgA